ncbi:hypothetical protein CYLTODRAFT_208976 [Cylindrobasidium torrendii FP15055 ss-10]|uniref:Uncharacterized protein n=1 Tax=Cylindrobasidium torrendii FP15055 ss-10 TaxID=1314674 RepID=A0A0D7BJY6_9AGAR|nr:hypothetical protein CYLTODRAFT_208976 [Cylindrobasidium torrendii FP15055 ss-10]
MGKYSPVKPPLDPRLPEPEGSLTQATTANRYADLCTDPLARLPVEMLKVLTENLWSQRSFHTHEQEHAYKEAHRVQQQEERLLTKCDLRKSRAHKNEAAKAERQTHISRRRSMSREASVVIIAPPLPPPPAKATRPKHQLSAPTQRMTEKQAPAPKKAKK